MEIIRLAPGAAPPEGKPYIAFRRVEPGVGAYNATIWSLDHSYATASFPNLQSVEEEALAKAIDMGLEEVYLMEPWPAD